MSSAICEEKQALMRAALSRVNKCLYENDLSCELADIRQLSPLQSSKQQMKNHCQGTGKEAALVVHGSTL